MVPQFESVDVANLTVADLLADPERNPSFFTMDTTTPFSKIMCSHYAYVLHIIGAFARSCVRSSVSNFTDGPQGAYLVVIAGVVALLARIFPRLKWMHVHAGRAFIVSRLPARLPLASSGRIFLVFASFWSDFIIQNNIF